MSHRHGCTINWTWSIRWHGTGLRRVDAHAGNPPIGIRRFHLLNSYSRNGPQITSFHNTASVSATVVPGNFFTVVSSSCCVYMIYTYYHVNLVSYFNSNSQEIHFLRWERDTSRCCRLDLLLPGSYCCCFLYLSMSGWRVSEISKS